MFCGSIPLTIDPIKISGSSSENFELNLPKLFNPTQISFTFFFKLTKHEDITSNLIKIKTQPSETSSKTTEINTPISISLLPLTESKTFGLKLDYALNNSERKIHKMKEALVLGEWVFVDLAFNFEKNRLRVLVSNLEGTISDMFEQNDDELSYESEIGSKLNLGKDFLNFRDF
jgi:hypothetical protein